MCIYIYTHNIHMSVEPQAHITLPYLGPGRMFTIDWTANAHTHRVAPEDSVENDGNINHSCSENSTNSSTNDDHSNDTENKKHEQIM